MLYRYKLYRTWQSTHDGIPVAALTGVKKQSHLVRLQSEILTDDPFRLPITVTDGSAAIPFALPATMDAAMQDRVTHHLVVSTAAEAVWQYTLRQEIDPSSGIRVFGPGDTEYTDLVTWDPQTRTLTLPESLLASTALRVRYFPASTPNKTTFEVIRHDQLAPEVTSWSLALDGGAWVIQGLADGDYTLGFDRRLWPEVRMASGEWYQQWTPFIRRGMFATKHYFYDTNGLAQTTPQVFVTREAPRWISPYVLQLASGNVKTYDAGGALASLSDINQPAPAETGILVAVNGTVVDAIEAVDEHHGVVYLKRPVPRGTKVEITYRRDTSAWAALPNIDMNPHHGHASDGQQAIETTTVSLYLADDTTGINYHYGDDYQTVYDQSGLVENAAIQPSHYLLATMQTTKQMMPDIEDLRQQGGGLIPAMRSRKQLDIKSHTGWGFYGGQAFPYNVLFLEIPQSAVDTIYTRYRDQGFTSETLDTQVGEYFQEMYQTLLPAGTMALLFTRDGQLLPEHLQPKVTS